MSLEIFLYNTFVPRPLLKFLLKEKRDIFSSLFAVLYGGLREMVMRFGMSSNSHVDLLG